MPFFGQSTGEPVLLPFGTLPPVARRQLPPRSRWPANQPPSPESEPGVPVTRPRCSSAPRRLPDDGAAPTPSIGCPTSVAEVTPTPSIGCPTSVAGVRGPGPPVARLRRPLDAVHADPVSRAIAMTPPARLGRSSWGAPISSTRYAASPVATGCPAARCVAAMWLLAPSGAALASWAGPVSRRDRPEGLSRQTRSLDPGLRALSGTAATFAPANHQVKMYFRIPRVIHRSSSSSPGIRGSCTDSCTALSPGPVDRERRVGRGRVDGRAASGLNGRRCAPIWPSSSLRSARAPHVLVPPPVRRLFCCPGRRSPPRPKDSTKDPP